MRLFTIIICLLLLQLPWQSNAQNYSLGAGFTDGQTVSTCTGVFWDSKISANYAPLENYSVTFCPSVANKSLQFNFTQMNIAVGDTLFVYDGNSVNANQLTFFVNINSNFSFGTSVIASDTNSTGCLTFRFVSDAVAQSNGWRGDIKCGYACKQRIQASVSTTPSRDVNGNTNICVNTNGKVAFDAVSSYPDNDLIYHQADTSTYFHWFFGDGKDTLKKGLSQVNHTYTNEGGYHVKLVMTDSNGCINKTSISTAVRTGIKPVFRIPAPPNICLGDTVKLTPMVNASSPNGGQVTTVTGTFLTLPISGDSLFLPDNTANTGYRSNILIDQFLAGQTLNNINDLRGIFMNMEHTYLGDLDITITAPNGTTVSLKNYPGGGGCYLGEPVRETGVNSPLATVAGKGYDYQFSQTPQHGTMVQESNLYTYSFIDNAGQASNNRRYLPAGSYASASPLSALVGTPLNGTWTLKIQDHLGGDNGFLFNWHIEFAPSLYPNIETFNVPLVSQNWVTPTVGLVQLNGTVATIVPATAGNHNFVYRVEDGFGCLFDTTVIVKTNAAPIKPNLGPDTLVCNAQTTILSFPNIDNTASYSWSTGQINTTQITVNAAGAYSVTATNGFSCISKDTIVVSIANGVTASLGNDTFYCASRSNVLRPVVSSNVTSYLWSNGTTADSLKVPGPGTYWVKCSSNTTACTATATIIVSDNPVNAFAMPNDTTICTGGSFNLILPPLPNTSYVWNDGTVGNAHQITAPNIYSVTVNNKGCLNTDNYQTFSKPMPTVSLGNDTFYCASRTNTLKPLTTNAISYLWSNGSIADTLNIAGTGTYWVKVSANGCTASDTVNVADNPVNGFVMPNDTTICAGDNFMLALSPPANTSITWNDGTVGNTHTITAPDIYTVIANNKGCLVTDTYQAFSKPMPAVNLGNDTFYCATKPNTIKPVNSSNVINYLWNNGSIADSLNITGTGTYWVKVSANGCSISDTINIANNPVNGFAMPLDTLICEHSSYLLTLTQPVNTTITWNDGSIGNSHLITGPATYSTVANSMGCLKPASFNVTTKPLPVISLGKDTILCNGTDYLMKVGYPNASFLWNNSSTDTFMIAKLSGIYWVESSLNNCVFRDSIIITYKKCECETIVPNAFSPNGDGINDLFVSKMECTPTNYQLSIFNRYGQPVFETRNFQQGWDGKKNGQPMPIGTYYYILNYYNGGLGSSERFAGSIALLR
jgi:gliding motility-associated-like protein